MSTIALKTIPKTIAKLLSIVCVGVLLLGLLTAGSLPAKLSVSEAGDIPLFTTVPMIAKADPLVRADTSPTATGYDATVKLFGVIPIGSTRVEVVSDDYVVPGGTPFGIKILAEGVMIVGFRDVETPSGDRNPAADAGLRTGDLILAVDGNTLSTNARLQELVAQSEGKSMTFSVQRSDTNLQMTVQPILSTDGKYRIGMWVRDSTAGLGTLTFYHPATGTYGGLGHGVCDSDTGEMISVLTGEIVEAKIMGFHKAAAGTAGEIKGTLMDCFKLGSITKNCGCGVYGQLYHPPADRQTVRVAHKQEVQTGQATVLSAVEGECRAYTCQIEKINLSESTCQNLVIRITDPALLSATGGIIQGMSGSPILQNGCLVGAVTHVFVNTPEKGYGVFAETMLENAKETANAQAQNKAS